MLRAGISAFMETKTYSTPLQVQNLLKSYHMFRYFPLWNCLLCCPKLWISNVHETFEQIRNELEFLEIGGRVICACVHMAMIRQRLKVPS